MLCAIACLCVYPLESQSDLPSLFPFSPNSVLLGVLNSFLRCVRPLCRCWCPPFSAGHTTILFICLTGLSLVVSAHFRWPCSISIHLSPRSVTAGVRPFSAGHVAFLYICLPGLSLLVSALFPLAMQHSWSIVSKVCHSWCPPFSAGHAAFLFICLAGLPMVQHFYSFVFQVCQCWCSPFSVGHVALLFICLPGLSLLVSALFRWPCSISIHLFPRSVTGGVRPFLLVIQHSIHLSTRSVRLHLSPRSVTAGVPLFPLAM